MNKRAVHKYIVVATLLVLSIACKDQSVPGDSTSVSGLSEENAASLAQHVLITNDTVYKTLNLVKSFDPDSEQTQSELQVENENSRQTMPCSTLAPGSSGQISVTPTPAHDLMEDENESVTSNLDVIVDYSACTVKGVSIQGRLRILLSTSEFNESFLATGSLVIDHEANNYNYTSFELASSFLLLEQTYAMNLNASLNYPGLGLVEVRTDTPFSGNRLNNPDRPTKGTLHLKENNHSSVQLNVLDNVSGFQLTLDRNGDGVFEQQVINPDNASHLFPWQY